jgi:5S rRNA maturation endonuclease (ribonuclease M5)
MGIEVEEVLRKYGYKNIMRSGRNLVATCILHKDAHPSFGINVESGAWQCFSCKAAGPHLVSLVARLEHCSDNEAKRKLYGGEDSDKHYQRIADWARSFTLEKPEASKPEPMVPSDLSLRSWRESKDAVAWLAKNKISEITADNFDLKWCFKGYYFGHVAVPIHIYDANQMGMTLFTYEFRRVIGSGINGKKVIYPAHSQLGSVVYNLGWLPENQRKVIIVEGCKDVWSLSQARGFAVSCFGTHVSHTQVRALLEKGVDEVALLFDGDEAGQHASKKVAAKLSNWFSVEEYQCPTGLDPNDCEIDVLRSIVKNVYAKQASVL